jgi:hypothetical protein
MSAQGWRKIGVASVGMENCVRKEIELSGHAAKVVPLVMLLGATAMSFAAGARTPEAKKVNLPYVTIDNPQFISASQAAFLSPDDMVIGVTDGKTAKAYPAAILAQHGVVQDQMADGPIAVTW